MKMMIGHPPGPLYITTRAGFLERSAALNNGRPAKDALREVSS
jgi:hypothetical protein